MSARFMSREKKYICILLNQHRAMLQKVDCWLNCPLPGLVGSKMMSPTTEIILPSRTDNGIALDWLLSRRIDWKEGLPIINEKHIVTISLEKANQIYLCDRSVIKCTLCVWLPGKSHWTAFPPLLRSVPMLDATYAAQSGSGVPTEDIMYLLW